MRAVVRYIWMFRTAAVLFLFLGGSMLWKFGFTGYEPQIRPLGMLAGALALAIGAFLFRRARLAVGMSAAAAGFICICAVLAVPSGNGPVILFFAAVALTSGCYAVLALRALRDGEKPAG